MLLFVLPRLVERPKADRKRTIDDSKWIYVCPSKLAVYVPYAGPADRTLSLSHTYTHRDQPYVAVIDSIHNRTGISRWVVAVTQNPHREGSKGRVAAYYSEDQVLAIDGMLNCFLAVIAACIITT